MQKDIATTVRRSGKGNFPTTRQEDITPEVRSAMERTLTEKCGGGMCTQRVGRGKVKQNIFLSLR